MLNKMQFMSMLQFKGGRPAVILRDHDEGRIKAFVGNDWIATVVPGHLMAIEEDACLLSMDGGEEWRGSFGAIAAGVSTLQQTGCWVDAYEAFADAQQLNERLGF